MKVLLAASGSNWLVRRALSLWLQTLSPFRDVIFAQHINGASAPLRYATEIHVNSIMVSYRQFLGPIPQFFGVRTLGPRTLRLKTIRPRTVRPIIIHTTIFQIIGRNVRLGHNVLGRKVLEPF